VHDIGHGPFGHFFDENYLERWGIDHEVVGRRVVLDEPRPADRRDARLSGG